MGNIKEYSDFLKKKTRGKIGISICSPYKVFITEGSFVDYPHVVNNRENSIMLVKGETQIVFYSDNMQKYKKGVNFGKSDEVLPGLYFWQGSYYVSDTVSETFFGENQKIVVDSQKNISQNTRIFFEKIIAWVNIFPYKGDLLVNENIISQLLPERKDEEGYLEFYEKSIEPNCIFPRYKNGFVPDGGLVSFNNRMFEDAANARTLKFISDFKESVQLKDMEDFNKVFFLEHFSEEGYTIYLCNNTKENHSEENILFPSDKKTYSFMKEYAIEMTKPLAVEQIKDRFCKFSFGDESADSVRKKLKIAIIKGMYRYIPRSLKDECDLSDLSYIFSSEFEVYYEGKERDLEMRYSSNEEAARCQSIFYSNAFERNKGLRLTLQTNRECGKELFVRLSQYLQTISKEMVWGNIKTKENIDSFFINIDPSTLFSSLKGDLREEKDLRDAIKICIKNSLFGEIKNICLELIRTNIL